MITTPAGTVVRPGDFAAVRVSNAVGRLIRVGEWLNGDGFRDYEHAIFYAGGQFDLILEAEPGGAKLRPYYYDAANVLWSTDNAKLALTPAQRARVPAVAKKYQGVPYSFLDYAALAAHRLHIWAPGLKDFIADTGHEICSQLADTCRLELGSHLFSDGRWPGYVSPSEIAALILS